MVRRGIVRLCFARARLVDELRNADGAALYGGHHDVAGLAVGFAFGLLLQLDEARAYLREPTLRAHLLEISSALLALDESDPTAVFGFPDDLKLRSSMTLFAAAAPDEPVFAAVLEKFFGGQPDARTLQLLGL